MSNFQELTLKNYYYVDKTEYIKKFEKTGRFLFLLRPRRFGKSLFLSMLQTYYDVSERENFSKYFAGTWIADHPTEERGTFQVLALDFSQVGGEFEQLEENFSEYICAKIDKFMDRYSAYYSEHDRRTIQSCPSFKKKLTLLRETAYDAKYSLYLIVDEYDNFTNSILAKEGHEVYHAITHATGFYRDVFKMFKPMFSRIIITGVSPVTLDDLTSGYNIANNVTLDAFCNSALGFTKDEVIDMIHYYQKVGELHPEDETKMMAEMAAWYDGYCFSEGALGTGIETFNSSMVIRYIQHYINNGTSPQILIDPNTKTDYDKLIQLLKLEDSTYKRTLQDIAKDGYTEGVIKDSFPAASLTDPDIFISLLYYYGMLTYTKRNGDTVLGIPNNNVRKQYYEYLQREYNKIHRKQSTVNGKKQ
jgi:hypothetical protein